jgi:hypothetical protein
MLVKPLTCNFAVNSSELANRQVTDDVGGQNVAIALKKWQPD